MKACPYKCSFCGQANDGTKKFRYQTPDHVVAQLKCLNKEYGINKFEFIDNVFTTNKNRAREIAEKLIESGLKIQYSVNDRLGNFDKSLSELLRRSGCFEVRVGVEACDPKVQEFLNKKLDIDKGIEQLKIIKDAGMLLYLYFTPGVPGETRESLDMNARFISDVDADSVTAGPLWIMPGSPLYYRYKKENKIIENDWSEYRKFDKLTYINESYSTIEEVMAASDYMLKKTLSYNMRRFDRGLKYILVNLINYLKMNVIIKKIGPFIPGIIKNRINKLTYKKR